MFCYYKHHTRYVMQFKIDQKFVLSCLSNYQHQLKQIEAEMTRTFESIISQNDLIETLQVKIYSESLGTGKTNNHRDLNNVIENVEKKQQEYIKDQLKTIEQLQLKEDALRRIWICFEALPYLEKDILTKLYIDNVKWDAIPFEMNISKGALVKRRAWALDQILKLYESHHANADIIRLGNMKEKRKKEINTTNPNQLCVFDFLNSNQ